jgi:ubiquinone/menaquinone biosynthesis C-methylase UbiE
MNTEQKVYELDEIWTSDWLSEEDNHRISVLEDLVVSKKVKSLADIGCGNGLFLNKILENHGSKFKRICGVERSSAAIKHLKTESILASIESIPISDNEFEFVTCQEVIEHLPSSIYSKAIQELGRISSKYILISVPYNENLKYSAVNCPACSTVFNPEFHMRSYKLKNLIELETLLNAEVVEHGFIKVKTNVLNRLVGKLLLGKSHFPNHTICPMCNYNTNSKLLEKPDSNESKSLKAFIKSVWPTYNRKRWAYVLFEKK